MGVILGRKTPMLRTGPGARPVPPQHRSAPSSERLERHLGKVLTVSADAQTSMRWTPGALADPEKYFRSQ